MRSLSWTPTEAIFSVFAALSTKCLNLLTKFRRFDPLDERLIGLQDEHMLLNQIQKFMKILSAVLMLVKSTKFLQCKSESAE